MKFIYTILIILIAAGLLPGKELKIKYTSEAGRRPALEKWRVDNDYSNVDHDNNGVVEIPVFDFEIGRFDLYDPTSGLSMCNCYCDSIWDPWPSGIDVGGIPETYAGLMDATGNGDFNALFIADVGNNRVDLRVADLATGKVELKMDGIIAMGLFDPDEDGGDDIVVADPNTKQYMVIGYDSGASNDSPAVSKEMESVHAAPNLKLKYRSEPNASLGYAPEFFETGADSDFDGDGNLDIITLVADANNEPSGLRVSNLRGNNPKWQFPFPESHKTDILRGFKGFFKLENSGSRTALFGHNTLVGTDKNPITVSADFTLLDVFDVDNDGLADLVGMNRTDNSIEVWGVQTITSASQNTQEIISFKLFGNYPNPFNPNTTISYSLESSGLVELHVYDILGRKIRTLVNERKAAGEYTVSWNGRNDAGAQVASGSYFYKLKVDGSQLTGRMILLK